MKNIEKYNLVFINCFDIDEDKLGPELTYQSIENWDSVGHMNLIAELEDEFAIMMETDDIIDFNSYETGKEILKKYKIEME